MSKKIMFNDKYGLTQAVLEGRKTMTRRICKYSRPDETYDIVFPVFEPNDFDNDGNNISPLNYAFGWMDNKANFIGWNIPQYKVGEVVAIAQNYASIADYYQDPRHASCAEHYELNVEKSSWYCCVEHPGFRNKLFVAADKMIHHIRITDIKIERLQSISEEDCLKEGVITRFHSPACRNFYYVPNVEVKSKDDVYLTSQEAFSALIDKVCGKGTFNKNPYVFAYEFKLVD